MGKLKANKEKNIRNPHCHLFANLKNEMKTNTKRKQGFSFVIG